MKITLLLAALLSLPLGGFAEEKTLKERGLDAVEAVRRETKDAADAASRTLREAWKDTKAYLSQDGAEYRAGASAKLDELSAEIDVMKKRAPSTRVGSRPYFATRLQALREHQDYARLELARMPADRDTAAYSAARKDFDHTIDSLEEAIDDAAQELRGEN